jgi:hypothetical protein
VDWRDNSNNETGFILQRALSASGPWTDIPLPLNTTSYRDSNLQANRRYYYRVVACNLFGCSAPSNTDSDVAK